MPRSAASERSLRGNAGFTLVEALAAFASVAMLSLALQRAFVQSRLGWQWIDDRVAAGRVARSLLEQPVSLARAEAGGWEGTMDSLRYRVRLNPADLALPEAPERSVPNGKPPGPQTGDDPTIRWKPMSERIEVETARGLLAIETIRLCPFQAKAPRPFGFSEPRG